MKRIAWSLAAFVLALSVYLSLWPVPIDPVAWQAPAAPGYVGVHAPNSKLKNKRSLDLGKEAGPEHVTARPDGKLYTGTARGHILRIDVARGASEVFSDTGGRPLGMAFDANGALIVADANKGLLSVAADGKATLLANTVGGRPILFANAVAAAANGKIYFTDSSTRFAPARVGGTLEAATLDILEQSSTGRVLEYDPATKAVRVLAKGLSLANGIVMSSDQGSVFVSECGKYRVWKVAVAADQIDMAKPSAQAQLVLDNLPGYPDNMTRGLNGKIWLGMGGPRNDLDGMADKPWLRKIIMRLPRFLWPTPKPYGHVMAFTEDGKVVADLQDPDGSTAITTGATETAAGLYIHSVDDHRIWVVPGD